MQIDGLNEILSVPDHAWLMSGSERVFIAGLVSLLSPNVSLELGVWRGKCTEWLARYSKQVYAVDTIDWQTLKLFVFPANVIFVNRSSDDAFDMFRELKICFDLIVVDADHSTEHAYRDLKNAMEFGKVIIVHDTFNPECRLGYEQALREAGRTLSYINLDLIPGSENGPGSVTPGKWAGIGMIVV